jgi:NADPH2:quinone reductase
MFGIEPPYVPGSGFVGRVIEIGSGVEPSWIGRAVAVDTGHRGGYVDRGVADADQLIPVPDGVGMEAAAALLHDGRTAEGLCEAVALHAGDRVLVLGAAGGLGLLLVQLARNAGAHAVAAARGAKKLELAAAIGANATVDYSDTDWLDRARAACGGDRAFDVIFDGIGGELGTAAFDLIATSGRFSAHGAASGGFAAVDLDLAEARGVKLNGIEAVQFAPPEARRLTAAAYDAAVAGKIRAVIGQSFPLARAIDAHRAIEARQVIGKTILRNDVSRQKCGD